IRVQADVSARNLPLRSDDRIISGLMTDIWTGATPMSERGCTFRYATLIGILDDILASIAGTGGAEAGQPDVRQVAPWRPRSQDPQDAIEDATVIHSWHATRLIRQHRLNGRPLIVREFVAHDSAPSVRGLNHGSAVRLNMPSGGALRSLFPPKQT